MILNHKDAIAFLVSAADDIGFNRYTILNLHGILAHNLLPDEGAAGRLRHIAVGIEKSTFHPLELPQLIEESFNQILATAAAIEDPFEQAFFFMVQLPYLQPFDDVNKRVSRLGANIPFIKKNLSPLSFTDVPRSTYTEAILGVYELNKVDLLKDVFIWAYERSAARYVAVRQSLGEPDPFRLRHRAALRQIVSDVVIGRMNRMTAGSHIASWVGENIPPDEREQFREAAETELLSLHEGNFARYQILPVAGEHALSEADALKAAPNYLMDELPARLAGGPVRFDLYVQVASADDQTDDPTVIWPADRPRIKLGTLTLTAPVKDQVQAQKIIMFNPLSLLAGIEPSADPVLLARPSAYGVSFSQRIQ